MTLEQLRGFIEVAHCLNFSRAAENLYMAQPNLSRAIAAMEKELGQSLFSRSKRSVALTKEGAELLSALEGPFRQVEAALARAGGQPSGHGRLLRIGISEGADFVPSFREIIYGFNGGQYGCDLIFDRETHMDLRQKLKNGDCDIIITTEGDLNNSPEIVYEILQRSATVVAISSGNPKASYTRFTMADFRGETLFLLRSPSLQRDDFRSFQEHIIRYDSLGSILTNVNLGRGIAVIPEHISVEQYPHIKTIPLVDDLEGTNLCIGWNAGAKNALAQQVAMALACRFRER